MPQCPSEITSTNVVPEEEEQVNNSTSTVNNAEDDAEKQSSTSASTAGIDFGGKNAVAIALVAGVVGSVLAAGMFVIVKRRNKNAAEYNSLVGGYAQA
jgi:sensor c-di-GMP phosphodiesterase-like protein